MEWKTSRVLCGAGVIAMLWLTGAFLTTSGGTLLAQSNDAAPRASLAGAWAVQVTLRDCETKAPLGPPFNSLVTYHRGGTLSESAGALAFAIGQRSSGHGQWARDRGHMYSHRMVALILFDTEPNLPGTSSFDPTRPVSPGFFAGWQTVTHTVSLTDADHFTSTGTNAFYKSNGELYRSGCSTALGHRFN
jgi:hypothetical protein